jgi:hypothetical protein
MLGCSPVEGSEYLASHPHPRLKINKRPRMNSKNPCSCSLIACSKGMEIPGENQAFAAKNTLVKKTWFGILRYMLWGKLYAFYSNS